MSSSLTWKTFETRVPGKWILTGEHAVIRGASAIAIPHPQLGLTLRYVANENSSHGFKVLNESVCPIVKETFDIAGVKAPTSGKLWFESSIPVGAGLGSSAALCVALTQWVSGPAGLPRNKFIDFATRLENYFHGLSSGLDIAVVSASEALQFIRGKGLTPRITPIGLKSLPRFTFHDTGMRAKTSSCVAQVESYLLANPAAGIRADARMNDASDLAIEGLKLFDSGLHRSGLQRIAEAMDKAHECFLEWQLVPQSVIELREKILSEGALAAKLTGAGGGGMLIALWDHQTRGKSGWH